MRAKNAGFALKARHVFPYRRDMSPPHTRNITPCRPQLLGSPVSRRERTSRWSRAHTHDVPGGMNRLTGRQDDIDFLRRVGQGDLVVD